MDDKKGIKIEITELFLAKCGNDFSRCFHGTIRRETDSDGNPVVYGKINVQDGYIYAKEKDQWALGDNLDQIVLMILDYGLHSSAGKTIKICDTIFFLN